MIQIYPEKSSSPFVQECAEKLLSGPYLIQIKGTGGKMELVSDDLKILAAVIGHVEYLKEESSPDSSSK